MVERLSPGDLPVLTGQVLGKGEHGKKQKGRANGRREPQLCCPERKLLLEGGNDQLGQRLLVCQVRGEMRSYCWV